MNRLAVGADDADLLPLPCIVAFSPDVALCVDEKLLIDESNELVVVLVVAVDESNGFVVIVVDEGSADVDDVAAGE